MRIATGSPAGGQPRAAKPLASKPLPNAAVMVVGPPGAGKGSLARALSSKLGAAYVHVPPDLARRVAAVPGGADIVLRSVARVGSHQRQRQGRQGCA